MCECNADYIAAVNICLHFTCEGECYRITGFNSRTESLVFGNVVLINDYLFLHFTWKWYRRQC